MSTKRMAEILRVLSLFLLIALATDAQAAMYSFKTFDVPGARNIFVSSINANGQVAGYYNDTSGAHGFVYSGGTFTSLDFPGALNTFVSSINVNGQVAGSYGDTSGGAHGFVYSGGTFTSLDFPGALNTFVSSINVNGQVAGSYYDTSGGNHGYVYSGGTFTSLDPQGAIGSYAMSINASGQVAGTYYRAPFVAGYGFVYSGGTFTILDISGAPGTFANSINTSGQVAGNYDDASGSSHGYVYSGSTFTLFDPPPGALFINVFSINDSGQVVGNYADASGSSHGYVYSGSTIPPTFMPLDVPGAGGTFAHSINASGQVAGDYSDTLSEKGATHGFIATPISPFSTFNVTRLVIDQNRGALFLWSSLALGKDSNGIDPAKEEVTLKIADSTMTIPAGSFQKNRYLYLSFFVFAGHIDNVWIEALIAPLGGNRFGLKALAYGAQLGNTNNPVLVELTIGDDGGTTKAKATIH